MNNDTGGQDVPKELDALFFDRRILAVTLLRSVHLVAIVSLAAFIIAVGAAKLFITDKWQARTVMIRHKKNMSLQSDMPYLYQELDIHTVLETFKLRRNLEAVIGTLGLDTTPESLFGKIKIQKGRKSDVIQILATSDSPGEVADIANTLADVFIKSFLPIQNSSAGKIYTYYLKQKEDALEKVRILNEDAQRFRRNKEVISLESETSLKFSQLNEIELKLLETDMLISDLTTKIEENQKKIDSMPEKSVLASTVKNSDEHQLRTLEAELKGLLEKYTYENPKVVRLQDKITSLKRNRQSSGEDGVVADEVRYGESVIRRTLRLENTRYAAELKAARKKAQSYPQQLEKLKENLQYLTDTEKEYFSIQRNLDLYKELLKKIEHRIIEAKIAMESNISDFEIIERAAPPRHPLGAHRKVVAFAGLLLGFSLSVLAVAARELMDFTVKSPFDFTRSLAVPCIGSLPDLNAVRDTVFFERFQMLFDNTLNLLPSHRPAVIVITGDPAGTGKSFIRRKMQEFFASQRKRVLCIDTVPDIDGDNGRHTVNHLLFNVPGPAGLNPKRVDEHLDEAYLHADEALVRTAVADGGIRGLIALAAAYDYVIWELFDLDFAIPLTARIGLAADAVLLVARYRVTRVAALRKAVGYFREKRMDNVYGIVNAVAKRYLV